MRAPWQEDPEGGNIGLMGVLFDGGANNRAGTWRDPARSATKAR